MSYHDKTPSNRPHTRIQDMFRYERDTISFSTMYTCLYIITHLVIWDNAHEIVTAGSA